MNKVLMWLVIGWLIWEYLKQKKANNQINNQLNYITGQLQQKVTVSQLDQRLQTITSGTVTQTDLTPFDYRSSYLNYN